RPAASGSIRAIPVATGPCAGRDASQVINRRYRDEEHSLALRDEGEHLARPPVPLGADRLGNRYLEFGRQRGSVLASHYNRPIDSRFVRYSPHTALEKPHRGRNFGMALG